MSAEPSSYQVIKIWLEQYVPVERDTLHFVIGALILALVLVLTRHRRNLRPYLVALTLALALAIAMELLDRRDDLRSLSYWRWQESLWDVLRTISIPALACIWMWFHTRITSRWP